VSTGYVDLRSDGGSGGWSGEWGSEESEWKMNSQRENAKKKN
jgi:hypothetical protein